MEKPRSSSNNKNSPNNDLIHILQQKKSIVIRNDTLKKETRTTNQSGSRKAAKTPPKTRQTEIGSPDFTSLTMNKLLQTMPGNKVQTKKKRASPEGKGERDQQLSTLDVKKLSMLAKMYAGTGQEIDKRVLLKERSKSMSKQQHYQEEKQDTQYKERSVSSLSFSRAFTFSMFDLPDSYRQKNRQIERRAYSVMKCR